MKLKKEQNNDKRRHVMLYKDIKSLKQKKKKKTNKQTDK